MLKLIQAKLFMGAFYSSIFMGGLVLSLLGWSWVTASQAPTVVSAQQIQKSIAKHGPLAGKRLQAWQALVNDNLNAPEAEKLKNVNDFFNEVRFVSDIDHWGKKDYWATPVEFLETDAGDCEDYVIAKYFTLKALGVAESKLYLTYVKAVKLNQAHMVLTYFENPKSLPLVLDNLNKRILPATQRKDLLPVYSFNGDGLWLAKERGKGQSVSSGTSKLTAWNELLKKLETSR
jgi:predicted transglutaminase-like cysteine proteinase